MTVFLIGAIVCIILDLLLLCHHSLGQTILLVTHDERLAAQAERVITLSDGRIVSDRRRG